MESAQLKIQKFLLQMPLFSGMSHEELEHVAQNTTELYLRRGETLFRQNESCVGFHLVLFGQIKLGFSTPQGIEKVIAIINPGQSFGEALMFLKRPYIVFSQALTDSLVLHISQSAILQKINSDPEFTCKMLASMSQRLHSLITDIEEYSLQTGAQRVIGYLMRNIEDSDQTNTDVILDCSKLVIASRLNLTPEHFSKILHDLKSRGLIDIHGKQITIFNKQALLNHKG